MLTVGGVEPRKGSLTLLEGFARLRAALPYRDPVLLVAGGATLFDYRHEVERFDARVAELGLTRHVRRLGALEPDEIERLFRAADVFAFPSVKEGFGLAALEALAGGRAARGLRPRRLPRLPHRRRERAAAPGRRRRRAGGRARARRARARAAARGCARGGREVVAGFTWDASGAAHEAPTSASGGHVVSALEVTAEFRGGFAATSTRAGTRSWSTSPSTRAAATRA